MNNVDQRPAAVLCDVDGVLRHRDPGLATEWERREGLPAGAIIRTALRKELLQQVVTGVLTEGRWRAEIVAELAGAGVDAAAAARAVDGWSASSGWVDQEILTLLDEVAQTVPVVLVSNGTTRLEADLDTLGVTARLPLLVNSARLGFAKPDPRIFQQAATVAGVPARDCLVVDDSASHLTGATEAGMATHLFTGAAGLRTVLGLPEDPQ